jgi:BNR/Asp-box repeat protein
MRKKSNPYAFFNNRSLIGLGAGLTGACVALVGLSLFSVATASTAQAQSGSSGASLFNNNLVPPGIDCASLRNLGIDKQENLRAGAIMIACGLAEGGGATSFPFTPYAEQLQKLVEPNDFGDDDADLITGAENPSHIIQSETFTAANPDNPNEIVVAYNDSRGAASNPFSFSGASVSTDGGNTFTRLTLPNGQGPFPNTVGDPVILFNRPTGTWFTIWLDGGCGGQGLGGFKSTDPSDPTSWTHFCVHNGSSDDRNSGWVDNNPSSPYYGRMYVSFNDFNRAGGALFVRYSTDNGVTWSNERQITTGFVRDVQITGDAMTHNVILAGMDEMGGGLGNRVNKIYRSTDGGATWTNSYSGPSFAGPGSTTCLSNSYFACMFTGPAFWRHMGWGQPAAFNGVVSYVYDARNTSTGDPANVFYIRSTDGGATFSAPLQLNTDTTTKRQWQPNISAAEDGSLLAVWYDEREATAPCVKGNPSVPCYRMYARKSLDNGATWSADMPFSDVVSPLPGQSDPNIVTEYAGDYDYSYQVGNSHLHTWTDGRVAVNSASQQDAFFDSDGSTGGGGDIVLQARTRSESGKTQLQLFWTPADGGMVNILRNGTVVETTADDGNVKHVFNTTSGTFTFQVCETDSGDCSNEVEVTIP